MRRSIGFILSFLLVASAAVMPASAEEEIVLETEEEIGFTAEPKDITVTLTFDQEEISFGSAAYYYKDAQGNSSLSIGLYLNEYSEDAETTGTKELELDDFLRVVQGTGYLNGEAIVKILGDSFTEGENDSISSVLASGWIEVPLQDLEDVVSISFPELQDIPEGLIEEFTGVLQDTAIDGTESGLQISLDKDGALSLAGKLDGLSTSYGDDLKRMVNWLRPEIQSSYRERWAEYIAAYASGRASVTGEETSSISDEVYSFIDALNADIAGLFDEFDFGTSAEESIETVLKERLGEKTIQIEIQIPLDAIDISATIKIGEGEDLLQIAGGISQSTAEEALTVEVPDPVMSFSDFIYNAAVLYYSSSGEISGE